MDLPTLFSLYAFIWGAIWGSFLNVVIYRVPRGLSLIRPGSRCPSCGRSIRWTENIPLLSYWLLRRRCRACGAGISVRYFLVEALTATLSLLLFLKCAQGRLESGFSWTFLIPFLFYFYFICMAIAIAFIDLELTVVPDQLTVPSVAVGVLAALAMPKTGIWADFEPAPTWVESVIGLVVGAGVVIAIYFTYRALTGRVGMGGGDATALAMIGAFFGWQSLLFVLFFASAQGLLVAVAATTVERVRGRPAGFLLRGAHRPEYWEERSSPKGPDAVPARGEPSSGEDSETTSEVSKNTGSGSPSQTDAAGAASEGEADEEVPFGKTGLPFAPFLMLAAVEYLFLGTLAQGWLMGTG